MLFCLCRRNTFIVVFFKHFHDQVLYRCSTMAPITALKLNWFVENFLHHSLPIFLMKVNNTIQKVVKNQPACPDIHFGCTNVMKNFRSKVGECSSLFKHNLNIWIHLYSFSKIYNFNNSCFRIKKYIFGFYIMMDNVFRMQIF